MQPCTVLNRIENDQEYKKTYPHMKGLGSFPATQEIHIFLAELNPTPERVQQYYDITKIWNEQHPEYANDRMKPCYLALVFRDADGNEKTVSVMQSARYFRSDDPDEVVRQCHQDADWFAKNGFDVIREKIEASAYGILGIPQNSVEADSFPTKYFEFHIKVEKKKNDSGTTTDSIDELTKISKKFTQKFKIPVPLSYNLNKDQNHGDGLGSQKFLNVRFRNLGIMDIKPKIEEIKKEINCSHNYKVEKVISEYVWYDSLTELDWGWIDYSKEELVKLVKDA